MNASTPPAPQGPPPEPRAPATTGRSGGGGLSFLLLIAALWFYTGPWKDARERMEQTEAAVQMLQQQVDSLRALVPPSSAGGPARDTATTRGVGDTVQQGAGIR